MAEQTNATGQAQQKAGEVAGQAQQKAQEAAGQARGMARDQADRRSTELGQRVRSSADDVRAVADELRDKGKEGPARVAAQAADRAERLGGWLERSDGDRILRDVEDFGRRNAWAMAAGGLALGFAAARMLKASSRGRYRGDERASRAQEPAAIPEASTVERTPPERPAPTGGRPTTAEPAQPGAV